MLTALLPRLPLAPPPGRDEVSLHDLDPSLQLSKTDVQNIKAACGIMDSDADVDPPPDPPAGNTDGFGLEEGGDAAR